MLKELLSISERTLCNLILIYCLECDPNRQTVITLPNKVENDVIVHFVSTEEKSMSLFFFNIM